MESLHRKIVLTALGGSALAGLAVAVLSATGASGGKETSAALPSLDCPRAAAGECPLAQSANERVLASSPECHEQLAHAQDEPAPTCAKKGLYDFAAHETIPWPWESKPPPGSEALVEYVKLHNLRAQYLQPRANAADAYALLTQSIARVLDEVGAYEDAASRPGEWKPQFDLCICTNGRKYWVSYKDYPELKPVTALSNKSPGIGIRSPAREDDSLDPPLDPATLEGIDSIAVLALGYLRD